MRWSWMILGFGLALTIPAATAQGGLTQLVVFGDSLSDTGNAYVATGGQVGTVATAFPFTKLSGGRFSNGPIWVEYLADRLGVPRPAPYVMGGTDFAFGGADTGQGFSSQGAPNLETQVGLFLSGPQAVTGNELFVLWAGSNDLAITKNMDTMAMVNSLVNSITALAANGGRTFLVPNLAPLDLTPFGGSVSTPGFNLNALVGQFNAELASALSSLESSLKVEIIPLDVFNLTNQTLANSSALGITNLTGSAYDPVSQSFVPNADQYFFVDGFHPTTRVHSLLADAAFEQVTAVVPEPTNLTLILSGLGAVGIGRVVRRRPRTTAA